MPLLDRPRCIYAMVHGRSDGYHQSSDGDGQPAGKRTGRIWTLTRPRVADDGEMTEQRPSCGGSTSFSARSEEGCNRFYTMARQRRAKGDDARWAICGGGHEIRRLGVMLGFGNRISASRHHGSTGFSFYIVGHDWAHKESWSRRWF
jgi:hypothetical protein